MSPGAGLRAPVAPADRLVFPSGEPLSSGRDTQYPSLLSMPPPRPHVHLVVTPLPRAERAVASTPLAEVFRAHSAFVATVAYKLLGRDDEVDDVVQDVFLAALRGLGALRDPDALRPWLASVTVRVVRRRLRLRRLRRWCGLEDAPEYEALAAPGASPEDRAQLARVYELLDGLPVDHRVAWCLRHVQGYGLEPVADACGCSLATAKRRIAAAHAVLTEALSDV
jgi:RNA polymerase sigma-70 factor (ECF subfamily)